MSTSIRRILAAFTTVAFVAGVALVALTGPTAAATPKTGHYVWEYDSPGTPYPVDTAVYFDVAKVGGKLKVKQFQWSTYSCSILTVSKAIAVKGKGKFKFKGTATSPGGQKVKINVKGKFKTKTKAKVTIFDEDPSATCGDPTVATVKLEK